MVWVAAMLAVNEAEHEMKEEWEGDSAVLTSILGPRSFTKGQYATCGVGMPWLVLADATGGVLAQTNNGLGEAWVGKVTHGGAP